MKGKTNYKYSYKKIPRNILYGMGMIVAITFFTVMLNLFLFSFALYHFYKLDAKYISGGEIMDELTPTEDGYVLSEAMSEKLAEENQWAMLLDENGREVWSEGKPVEVGDSYTQADIARMTRWYLKGYPVRLRVWDDRIMVVGMQRDVMWKYNIEMTISWMDFVKWVWAYFLIINIVWIVVLTAVFIRRFMKNREQTRIEWIAGISHDIRTPLSMVMGYADTLERNGELSEEARQQAAVIRHQSLVMKELIADLNLTSQLEYSMQPFRKEEVRPAEVLRSIVAAFLNDNPEGTMEIALEIAQGAEQLTMRADRQLLLRAFRNLIGNSMRHSGQEEAVSMQISLWREKRKCCIRFEDKGVGYSEEVLRGLQSRSKNDANPNIRGLEIVKKIVQAHGGRVRFGNRKEGGSFCEMWFLRS
ncbi:MAG: HAMP domain-containing histidine kinase [Lachnospiraceae bacterium]|nr:HAMP domain-containing histidine kinase [Lachnospiraceae bacterium]